MKEIVLESSQKLEKMIEDNEDFIIHEAVVNSILENLDNKRNNIHLLSLVCKEDNYTFNITLEKKWFAQTLKENLVKFVEREKYEECEQIKEAINKLEK